MGWVAQKSEACEILERRVLNLAPMKQWGKGRVQLIGGTQGGRGMKKTVLSSESEFLYLDLGMGRGLRNLGSNLCLHHDSN